jgi:hypothetical protein
MTTGTTGTPSIPAYSAALQGSWRYRDWSGSNGKYTGAPGGQTRWNDYVCYQEALYISRCSVQFRCNLPGGGTDTTVGYTPQVWRVYPPNSDFGDLSGPINNIIAKILSKVKGHSWNMAVDLAQGKQTLDLLTGTLGSLGRSVMALRHGDFATAARQLGASPRPTRLKPTDISGRWLELQYGWLPLLGSCYEASKAFEAISNGPRTAKFKSGFSKTAVKSYSAGPLLTKQKFRYNYGLTFEMKEEMSVERQLGLLDPLSVAWELVPYSFVVDWFVPIGTYLSNLNQLGSLSGRWLSSRRVGTEGDISFDWVGGSSTYPFCGYHAFTHRYQTMSWRPSFVRNAAYYARDPLAGPPKLPFPKTQGLPEAMSPRRFWNALSLAHQRFSGSDHGSSFVSIGGDLLTPAGRWKRP